MTTRYLRLFTYAVLALALTSRLPVTAQQILGAITGTVMDSSGAAVGDATVKAVNTATNLEVTARSEGNGSYVISNIPAGTYKLTITKEGFDTETHTDILVNANRTTTVNGNLKVGQVTTTVEVTATPLMNQVDTTNGYVVDTLTIEQTPLGTGSFTQLAILTPGVHADFLQGSGSNAGLGNQAIFANGQRASSNSFSLNGISTNNLFNGNTTSSVSENRFVLNTGENFGSGGAIQTSTSVYNAIGQALPTPPAEAIQEIAVNAAMYDAKQGANSGAHISVLTKSGTNEIHGQVYEKFQNSFWNAAPFFYNADPTVSQKVPFMNRNQFGATLGGPIKKDKLFYFLSYQGVRVADAADSQKSVTVPLGLTNDRSAQGIVNAINNSGFTDRNGNPLTITASQIDPAAFKILNAKLKNGQYLIPSAQITNPGLATQLGFDAIVQGPNATANVDQGIAAVDYVVNDKDRLGVKYYVQDNPTTNPFGSVSVLQGFPQVLSAGSQVGSINNTVILTPALTWEQRVGFTRLRAFAHTSQEFSPSDFGINLLGSNTFPQMEISNADPTLGGGLTFGPRASFDQAGMFQNQWEYGTTLNWVKGRHTLSFGAQWDHTQLNIINDNTNTDVVGFRSFVDFVEGVTNPSGGTAFTGNANRYYRSDTVGLFANDNFKLKNNLTLTLGVRWDYDGPLTEKYGRLTSFDGALYSYDASTDTINNSGLIVASNNKQFGTPGVGDSLMRQRQWGVAPRIGIAWSPWSKITIRSGFGLYYDRGEFFGYFSPSAGFGVNGPFGVTLEPPFVAQYHGVKNATLEAPFGTTPLAPPPANLSSFLSMLPNLANTSNGTIPFLFGGYDINNKLPYTENWTFDIQYQPSNSWIFTVGYVGNHGVHEILPNTFNQAQIATPQNPIHGQIYSYGGVSPNFNLDLEPISTPEFSGNAPVRVPYLGYDMNSVLFSADGISNYNALQLQARKRLSFGLTFTASYTWSHALDEQSGLGLFFTGNNPSTPRSSYASADFDQTHVFLVNYSYQIPNVTTNKSLGYLLNGWIIGGQTVAQSGQPYSIYDYSGSVGSMYLGTSDYIGNPIVPLKPGVTVAQAQLQGTTGINASRPVLNANDFLPAFLAPGQDGVPPCDATGCDYFESLYGYSGRNTFRAPFQVRFDMTIGKTFQLNERFRLRFNFDAFNLFNHPDFDTPNNNVTFFPNFSGPPSIPPVGSLGYIQHTIGSPRFLQASMHLTF